MVLSHCQQAGLFSFPPAWLLEDSCSSLREAVGTHSMGTECPAVASLEACWPGLGSVPSLRGTQRKTMLSESTAQGAPHEILGRRAGRRSRLYFCQTRGV